MILQLVCWKTCIFTHLCLYILGWKLLCTKQFYLPLYKCFLNFSHSLADVAGRTKWSWNYRSFQLWNLNGFQWEFFIKLFFFSPWLVDRWLFILYFVTNNYRWLFILYFVNNKQILWTLIKRWVSIFFWWVSILQCYKTCPSIYAASLCI